jgi:transcriptional regulator with XRE-family HTH domain
MELDYIALGRNIKNYRLAAKMTQRQLAELAGCSDRHIGHIESGQKPPSLAMTVAIANALNVGLDRLVYRDLQNCTDSFIQEMISFTEGFDTANKKVYFEMVKALLGVLKDFSIRL